MSEKRIDESLWFEHQDGHRLYPWYRRSGHHGRLAFWVSDGSNHIEDAEPVESVEKLVDQVFRRNRSIWLRAKGGPALPGLYKLDGRVLKGWGAEPNVASLAIAAGGLTGATVVASAIRPTLPTLIEKAVHDAGFDLISPATDSGYLASVSGLTSRIWISSDGTGAWVALQLDAAEKIGLKNVGVHPLPEGMRSIGWASSARELHDALHDARILLANEPTRLSERVERRLAVIPATERTRGVRQRIGQDVFREALFELWDGRCAISGERLPRQLLRASHAKPWAVSDDEERLDPFNGLLLAVHYDALFDAGLISLASSGRVLISGELDGRTRQAMGLVGSLKVCNLRPGHLVYLAHHRKFVAPWADVQKVLDGEADLEFSK